MTTRIVFDCSTGETGEEDFDPTQEPGYLPPAPPTVEAYQSAIQSLVDGTARSKQFNDGVAIASYIASTNEQWAAEAAAFVAWRDGVWGYAYEELAKVQGGDRAQPSVEEFLAELPAIVWPT